MLLCLSLKAVIAVSAEEYEVDGQIEQTIFKMDGSVQVDTKSKFTVFVNDCSWLIQTTVLDAAGKPVSLNETACTNGGLIYSVGGRIDKDNVPGGRNGVSGWNYAKIYSNNVPVGQTDDYFVCHLWLMFASGCYFANLTTNWLTPAYDLNAAAVFNPSLKREARWELANGRGSLPLRVVYFRDAHLTNGTYIATGVTNVGKIQIPNGFVFNQYATKSRVRKRATATVTAIRPSCSRSELMPEAQGTTMVIDQRLATNITNVSYYKFANGVQWVPVEKAKKLAIPNKSSQIPSSKVKFAFYILLLLPSVFLLYFLIKRRR